MFSVTVHSRRLNSDLAACVTNLMNGMVDGSGLIRWVRGCVPAPPQSNRSGSLRFESWNLIAFSAYEHKNLFLLQPLDASQTLLYLADWILLHHFVLRTQIFVTGSIIWYSSSTGKTGNFHSFILSFFLSWTKVRAIRYYSNSRSVRFSLKFG
jgi:hypothetical protein